MSIHQIPVTWVAQLVVVERSALGNMHRGPIFFFRESQSLTKYPTSTLIIIREEKTE